MAKLPRPRVVSKDEPGIDLPDEVSVALREISATAKQGLLALSVGIGLQVVQEIFEEQATGIAGEKGKHDPGRRYVYTSGISLRPLSERLCDHKAVTTWPDRE